MRAWLNIKHGVSERHKCLIGGLKRLGYKVEIGVSLSPRDGDIFVTWNRIGIGNECAKLFESLGYPVIVIENAAWGNEFAGERWYSMARNRHNTAGMFPVGGNARWDDLGINLLPFRTEGETVLLPQRGIGSPPTAMPREWLQNAVKKYGGRIRSHPGQKTIVTLESDLAHCGRAITWGSGAAIKALMMGIPVISEMPEWIGYQDNSYVDRLAMFRRLAWAQWRLSEIDSGEAIARMLN